MTQLTAKRVTEIFTECLHNPDEDADEFRKEVTGLHCQMDFHTQRLSEYREEIITLLNEFPDPFKKGKGDGWSFLNMCVDKNGRQWADTHFTCDQLLSLGLAVNALEFTLAERQMWAIFPGGMPYITVTEVRN